MAKTSPYESEELTDSIFLILLTMLHPIHGYRIMQQIDEMTVGAATIGPATMYTTLKKMKAAGWISEIAGEEAKILYQITAKGKDVLLKDYSRRQQIVKLAEQTLGGNTDA